MSAERPAVKATGLDALRLPFPAHQISKLPKQQKRDDQDKGKCERGSRYSADGFFCGGWHARSLHLDYVGHAALTDRLLDADPAWSWEPAYRDVDPAVLAAAVATGNPEIVRMVIANAPAKYTDGGLWIRLTVDGVSRLGFGDAGGKSGTNAVKELIGDCLRNAALRFGAALDLWHKGDLHIDDSAEPSAPADGAAATNGQAPPNAARAGADAVRAEIAKLATERDWPLPDVTAQFHEWTQGGNIKDTTSEILTAFYALLKDGTVAVGA